MRQPGHFLYFATQAVPLSGGPSYCGLRCMLTGLMDAPPLALDDQDPLDPPSPVEERKAQHFLRWMALAAGLLLVFFVAINIILPRMIFEGAPLTYGEAERLQQSVGLIETAMKIEQRKGNTVKREAVPTQPDPDDFRQVITLTVTTPAGVATVYRFEYALIPALADADRIVQMVPLNRAGAELLTSLGLPFEAPATPLPDG